MKSTKARRTRNMRCKRPTMACYDFAAADNWPVFGFLQRSAMLCGT